MVERLLLDGVNTKAGRAPVAGQHNLVIETGAHEANTPLTIAQFAGTRADVALNSTVVEGVPVSGWDSETIPGRGPVSLFPGSSASLRDAHLFGNPPAADHRS